MLDWLNQPLTMTMGDWLGVCAFLVLVSQSSVWALYRDALKRTRYECDTLRAMLGW